MEHLIILIPAALIAGMLNGVAGGGGLVVFPALLIAGVSPVDANATNTAALWFGTLASCFAYRRELITSHQKSHQQLFWLTATSIAGGIGGSYLLLNTSSDRFSGLVPYLMLLATLLFIFSPSLMRHLSNLQSPIFVVTFVQFLIAIYGGYFGGGGGILMLVMMQISGIKNIHTMNAFKSWLATCTNAVAIINFSFAQKIIWLQAIVMAIAAILGGYSSAYIARLLPTNLIRMFIICVGLAMTCYLFVNDFASHGG